MRSQDQRNRSPRPFKSSDGQGRWSGGNGQNFIPGAKPKPKPQPALPPKKPSASTEADTPPPSQPATDPADTPPAA